ncbi:hypothetical protein B0H13DRAFT_1887748 [Mycena leptocephala]|nr:hypothetical protein B0H13DRAFT_1887748 [Mycena leptocephala]
MSLSRALPSDTAEYPLLVDARGYIVQTELGSQGPPAISGDPPSSIVPAARVTVHFEGRAQGKEILARHTHRVGLQLDRGSRTLAKTRTEVHSLLASARRLRHLAERLAHPVAPSLARTRIRRCSPGVRMERETPLTREDLWLTDERPPAAENRVEKAGHESDNFCQINIANFAWLYYELMVSKFWQNEAIVLDPQGYHAFRKRQICFYHLKQSAHQVLFLVYALYLNDDHVNSNCSHRRNSDPFEFASVYSIIASPLQPSKSYKREKDVVSTRVHHHRPASGVCQISSQECLIDLGLCFLTDMNGRHEDELREKARERMARQVMHSLHREQLRDQGELAEEARSRARQASKKYREKHAATVAHRQRIVRMEAYQRKHGHRAWLERYEKLQAQRAEARELEELRRYEEEFRLRDEETQRREKEGGA